MPQTINTNIMSLNAQRHLDSSQSLLARSIERLSSGMRINSAKDDAAGMAVAEGMTSKIRGLNVAKRNANDGISLAQTAEAALGQITNNMQRIRELAVQSANGTLGETERNYLQKEVDELTAEIKRIVDTTEFNGKKLFDNNNSVEIQIGANKGEKIAISNVDLTKLKVYTDGYKISETNPGDGDGQANAEAVIEPIDPADATKGGIDKDIQTVIAARSQMGAVQNRFESVIANISAYSENLAAARSRITDTDFAMETANMTRAQILQQAGVAMVAQANSVPQGVLQLLR